MVLREGETEVTIEKTPGPCPYEETKWCTNCKEKGLWAHNKTCKKYQLTQRVLKHVATHGGDFNEVRKKNFLIQESRG